MDSTFSSLLMLAATVLFVVLLIKLLLKPIKAIFKFLLHALFGCALLYLVSFLGEYVGLIIEVNTLNLLIATVCGVPGVILLALYQFLF